jgi:hypothetical protein
MEKETNRRIIYRGQCIDNQDPLCLGRIRAIPKTDNTTNIEKSNEYEEWGYNDPFLYLPLIPFFVQTPPKVDEYVHLLYSDIDKKSSNDRFYIGGVYSSPTRVKDETYDSAVSNLDYGSRNKEYQNLKDVKEIKGVFAEPNDISLYGRGNADIVVQDNTVVIRAGKNKNFNRNGLPLKNNKRAFLQLSKFDEKTTFGDAEKKYVFKFDDANVKKLIEYDIISSDDNGNNIVGSIYIYNLSQNPGTKASKIRFNTNIPSVEKSLATIINCGINGEPITLFEFAEIINNTLNNLIEKSSLTGLVDDSTTNIQILGPSRFDGGNVFPLYYRFEPNNYNILRQTTSGKIKVTTLMSLIKTTPSQENNGYGLVYSKERESSVPYKPEKEVIIPQKTERFDKSVGIIGGDEIYLLSHQTQKPNTTEKINMEDTLYKINENKIADEIEPKTSSMVRGEELLEIIGLIVKFLSTHTHAYPGLPPVPISHDGTNVSDILEELLIASEKILNQKIRIN